MKELRCIVADKRVAEVMDALDGLVLDSKWSQASLANQLNPTVATNNHVARSGPHNGSSQHVDLFMANAKAAKAKTITGKQLVQHMKMGGFSQYSYAYRLNQLLKDKVLKKTKTQGVYEVIQ